MNAKFERKTRVRIAVAALVLGGAGFYAYGAVSGREAARTFYGSVDVRNVSVGFRGGGRVAEVLVDEGDQVKAGQVLARLDSEPYAHVRDESRAARDAAAARLALLEKGYDGHDVAQAAARVTEQRAALTNAVKNAERMAGLRATGAQSQRAVDDAETLREETAARLNVAQQELARLRRGFRSEEIAEARANLAHAEATHSRAALQFDDTELKAPGSGIVQTRVIEPGSLVGSGASAFVLTRGAETWIRAYVPEPMLGSAVPGTPVAVYTDARPDHPYVGRVGSVSPQAEFTPKSVETTDLRTSLVYRVRVLIDRPDSALRQGMPVTLRFAESEK